LAAADACLALSGKELSLMRTHSRSVVSSCLITLLLVMPGLAGAHAATPEARSLATPFAGGIGEIRVIGVHVLNDGLIVDETPVGGFSGIDYDPIGEAWYIVSDDRSDLAPARFYTANLEYSSAGFSGVSIDSAVILMQMDGTPYPNADEGGEVPDTESIRIDPAGDLIWYSSEGDLKLGLDPFIAAAEPDGTWAYQPRMPEIFQMDPSKEIGPHDNKGIEAMTFSADGETIWFAMEAALHEDGELSTSDVGSVSRMTWIDRSGNVLVSHAYELDPLGEVPEGGRGTNGLAEILYVDDTTFLSLERLSIQDAEGEFTNYIRIYEIDVTGATDVSTMLSLDDGEYTPVSKRLVLDINATGVEPVDNIEGMSWGPVLDNGNRSLVLVSDNNFNPGDQVTEFIALEVLD
jgi:hypothetical protein